MNLETLNYIVPPECAGQIIELAYANTPEGLVRRTTNHSNGDVVYEAADWDEVEGESESWNSEPTVDANAWRQIGPVS